MSWNDVFDPVRKRYVALTPEEAVRQQVIAYLHHQLHYPLELMRVEGSIQVNGLSKRCDIVMYDKAVRPMVIVECKQPSVALSQKVVDQIGRYNMVLQVPYLYLTNGVQHLVLYADFVRRQLFQLPKLPSWDELSSNC